MPLTIRQAIDQLRAVGEDVGYDQPVKAWSLKPEPLNPSETCQVARIEYGVDRGSNRLVAFIKLN